LTHRDGSAVLRELFIIYNYLGGASEGELTTGSLFLRGKESWFLAISVEKKASKG